MQMGGSNKVKSEKKATKEVWIKFKAECITSSILKLYEKTTKLIVKKLLTIGSNFAWIFQTCHIESGSTMGT